MLKKIIFLSLIFALCCISITGATINITVDEKSDSYIKWSWEQNLSITNMSIDGYRVVLADTLENSFVLSGLYPNETHTIKLYTSTDSGEYTETTNPPQIKSTDSILSIILINLPIMLIVILLYFALRTPFIGFIAMCLSFVGILTSVNNSFIYSSIYAILVVASIYVSYDSNK